MPRPYDPNMAQLLRRAAVILRQDKHYVLSSELESAAGDVEAPSAVIDGALEKQIEAALEAFPVRSAMAAVVKAYQDAPPFLSSPAVRMAERALARQIILASTWRQ